MLAPRLNAVMEAVGDKVDFAKVDIDELTDIAMEYGVSSLTYITNHPDMIMCNIACGTLPALSDILEVLLRNSIDFFVAQSSVFTDYPCLNIASKPMLLV